MTNFYSCPPSEIRVAQLAQARATEAHLMSAMDDRHRKIAQPFNRRDISGNVGAWKLIEQRSVVDRIAGKQDAGLRFPQPDAAGRVSGEVQDLECAIAGVD